MKCSRVRDRFTEYMEGTLKGGELRAVEEHLARCEECSRELSHIRELDARLRREVPVYWGSLEPSAGFISRLRAMDFEPENKRAASFIDSIFGLWANHRLAFSGGLAVFLIIALALAIPVIYDDNGDDSGAHQVAESTQDGSGQELYISGTAVASPAAEDGWSLSGEAEGTTEPPSPTLPPEPTEESRKALICGEAAEGSDTAIEIALDSDEFQETLQGKDVHCVEVLEGVELEGYTCSGSTVAIFTDETEPLYPEYYICVNVGSETVTSITLVDQP